MIVINDEDPGDIIEINTTHQSMTPSVMTPSMTPPMAPSRVPSIASSMSHTPTTQHAIVVSDDDQDDMIQIIATH